MSATVTPVTPTACDRLKQLELAYLDAIQGNSVRSVTDENGEQIQYSGGNTAEMLRIMELLQSQCTTYTSMFLMTGRNIPRPIGCYF